MKKPLFDEFTRRHNPIFKDYFELAKAKRQLQIEIVRAFHIKEIIMYLDKIINRFYEKTHLLHRQKR